MKLYGIPNCDTVKKARKWLGANNVAYDFHDYKKQGACKDTLESACASAGWEAVLNKRGTTWRKLDDNTKDSITDANSAIALMMEHTSTIKRPIAIDGGDVLVGFDDEAWKKLL